MEKLILKIEKREPKEKAAGKMPAVIYGPKTQNQPVFVLLPEFKRIWKKAGESTLIKLLNTGSDSDKKLSKSEFNVLIYDVQLDPISEEPIHADFYAVDMTKKTIAVVPLEFVGDAPAIKLGGALVKVIHEVEVEALPLNLPHALEVDLSALKSLEDKILIKDIKIPESVEILAEPDEVVALVEEIKEEQQPTEEMKIEDIEATGEKKEEKGGEEEKEETIGGKKEDDGGE